MGAGVRPAQDWGGRVSKLPPVGTTTLLTGGVEGCPRLDGTPTEQLAALAQLDRTLTRVISAHDGVRVGEPGDDGVFLAAFACASDALAAAVDLQRAPLAPLSLRIGVHTGEVHPRDDGGDGLGATRDRAVRLCELAHGRQTLLSGVTAELVADRLPADVWLVDLGRHPVRDAVHRESVVQVCHPDLPGRFPPLRTTEPPAGRRLPVQLTSFVGRAAELAEVRQLVAGNRLVTLTGAGGVGKTRLAAQLAAQLADGCVSG